MPDPARGGQFAWSDNITWPHGWPQAPGPLDRLLALGKPATPSLARPTDPTPQGLSDG